jgi:hypothetical protein
MAVVLKLLLDDAGDYVVMMGFGDLGTIEGAQNSMDSLWF